MEEDDEEEEEMEEEEEELELDVEGEGEEDGASPSSGHMESARKTGGGMAAAKQPVEKRHKCDQCGKKFPYYSILEAHKRCHTGG
jgi:hypothetical protein